MKRGKESHIKVFEISFVVLILIFCNSKIFASEWSKTFGGSANDRGYSVQQNADGGFIVAGVTESFGDELSDVFLIKTDDSGNKKWSKIFGEIGLLDTGYSVQQTADGGFIITGEKGTHAYLIKTNSSGNKQWGKSIGAYGSGYSVQQTADGGFIITGLYFGDEDADVYLIKTNGSGNVQWSKIFGGIYISDVGYSVQQTNDGGFIITGRTEFDAYLIKTNASGNKQWSKTFGGTSEDTGSSVQQTADGGFIIAGSTKSFGAGGSDVYLIKTDASGSQQWSKTFGGTGEDTGSSVQQTDDGGYIIAGTTDSFGAGGKDVYLTKTDDDGNQEWSKTFGGTVNDAGLSVQQATDGGYILAGHTESFGSGQSDVYLIYYNPTLTCGGKQPTIIGTEGHDVINGTAGPEVIHGLGGNDIIQGLGGDDVICGGDGSDVISAGSGNDIVLGENGHDAIWGGAGNDTLRGGDGNDSIYGGPGNDNLYGNHGNDSLYGKDGVDELYGGWGPNSGSIDNNDTCYDTAGTLTKGCEVFYEQ